MTASAKNQNKNAQDDDRQVPVDTAYEALQNDDIGIENAKGVAFSASRDTRDGSIETSPRLSGKGSEAAGKDTVAGFDAESQNDERHGEE